MFETIKNKDLSKDKKYKTFLNSIYTKILKRLEIFIIQQNFTKWHNKFRDL